MPGEPLSEASAEVRLRSMVAADEPPALSNDEVSQLVEMSRRRDRFGLYPSEDGWEPTWNLPAGAAEGWRWKAGKAVSKFQFSADGHTFSRQQIHQHCLDQAERYDRLAVQSSKTGRHDRDVGLTSGVIVNQ